MPESSEIVLKIRMGTSSLVQPRHKDDPFRQCILRSTAEGGKEKRCPGIMGMRSSNSKRKTKKENANAKN